MLNATNARGQTALYCASHSGHDEIVFHLLSQRGVDVNAQNPTHGGTALHAASFNAHSTIVAMLLWKGAKLEIANTRGLTAHQEAKAGVQYVYSQYHSDPRLLMDMFPRLKKLSKTPTTPKI